MASRFDCWSSSYRERAIYARDATEAAEIYFRVHFGETNLPEDSKVFVENDEGNIYEFNVKTELVRLFKATESTYGVLHTRHDGSECPYLADVHCNKCGWYRNTPP